MRQYLPIWTILVIATAFVGSIAANFGMTGIALGQQPVYPVTPSTTQSGGYGIVPYAPQTPTMVTRPASWPQGSLREPSGMTVQGQGMAVQNQRAAVQNQRSVPNGSTMAPYSPRYGQPRTSYGQQGSVGYSQQRPVGTGGYPANTGVYAPGTGSYAVPGANYNAGTSTAANYSPVTNYNAGTSTVANYGPAANYNAGTSTVANGYNSGRRTDVPFVATAEIKPLSDAALLARVGTEVVLASDVMALAAFQLLGEMKEPIPEDQRENVLQGFLKPFLETKLIYADFVRNVPAEGLAGFRKQIERNFAEDKEGGLPSLMKKADVKTREELEAKLQMLSSSLDAQKRLYVEQTMWRYWLSQEVKVSEPITHEQMLAYYRDHAADFDHEARARWEQLTIRFSRHEEKREAFAILAQAGNQVQRGISFSQVAKQSSEGTTADEGGKRDWITKGSLVSESLDTAVFALPVGQLSQIIEDKQGYHIIRVVERKDSYRTPFLQAQKSIKKELIDERFSKRAGEYTARLKRDTMIWTAYDDKKEQPQNLAETPGENSRR